MKLEDFTIYPSMGAFFIGHGKHCNANDYKSHGKRVCFPTREQAEQAIIDAIKILNLGEVDK